MSTFFHQCRKKRTPCDIICPNASAARNRTSLSASCKLVKPDAARVGTIVSLTDKCDSCVILQICGTCHDQANDPGFEFEVEKKIEAQKHGTKPPAAMQQAPSASLPRAIPSATWVGSLERGFAHADDRG